MSRSGHFCSACAAAATIIASVPNAHGAIAAGATIAASSLPDISEGVLGYTLGGTRLSLIPHRTATHAPLVWLALLVFGQLLPTVHAFGRAFYLGDLAAGLAAGALLHCLIDAFSPSGIPMVRPFGARSSFGPYTNHGGQHYLYKTGSPQELWIVAPLVAVGALALVVRWPLVLSALVGSTRLF